MTILQIDIETYSSTDLIKCGVYRYTEAPDFEILLFAYAYDDEPVTLVDLTEFEDLPEQVLRDLTDPLVTKTAFNAAFERTAIAKHYGIECDPRQWRCTAVHSLALGLPGSLGMVAEVLNVEDKKDSKGKALIKYFSVPCKPSKKNELRERNYPHHAPDKWEEYKAYCVQDVVVEREVRRKLERFPVPDHEWKLWALDQKINDRGVRLDPVLIDHAIACAEQYTVRLTAEAKELTGLDNPNSLTQLKGWLSERGLETPDGLGKDHMASLLDYAPDEDTKRVLELRQEMGKTSIGKYDAMARTICSDDHVRGILQFCGANRTWRWAGRIVQMHNLPQNHIDDLEVARSTLRSGDYEMLEMMYGAPPSILSQLLRTALIPSEGNRFIVSDFAAIEARVIAWLADEQWVLDVFMGHGKIYEATASRMFGVLLETIVKGHENYRYRPPGKVATLACIAEGQRVLTDSGLVKIEAITKDHMLWDGEEWVRHDGLIYKGEKRVLSYDGLTATPDHLVWTEGEQEPIHFGYAAACGKRLVQSGSGRCPVRVGENHKPRTTVSTRLESMLCSDGVYELQTGSMVVSLKPDTRSVERVSTMFTAEENTSLARQANDGSKTALRECERSELFQLRGERDSVQISIRNGSRVVGYGKPRTTWATYGDRSEGQQRSLRAGELAVGYEGESVKESESHGHCRLEPCRLAVCVHDHCSETVVRVDTGSDYRRSTSSSTREAEELARHSAKVRVYDILNSGPRNRFTVSGRLVHNCGFGGGVKALEAMDKKKEIPADDYDRLVKQWRKANPNIVKLWYKAQDAAMKAVEEKTTVKLAHGVQYRYEAGTLFADLPSGHSLAYPKPEIKYDPKFEKDSLTFYALDERNKWSQQRTWGGTLVENLVQAIARDCLAESLTRVDAAGYQISLHVHDECVLDVPFGSGSVEKVCEIMGEPISWAKGLPLKAEGFETEFYRKD